MENIVHPELFHGAMGLLLCAVIMALLAGWQRRR